MMLMPSAAPPAPITAAKRSVQIRRGHSGNKVAVRIENVHSQRNVDRRSAAVESALQVDDFKRDTIVVDAVSAVKARPPAPCRPIQPDARAPVVRLVAAPVKKGDEWD